MKIMASVIIGYLIGCVNPAAIISKRKNVNLKQEGTGNLGATNTAYVMGRGAGITVLIADIMKSVLSAKLVKLLFPQTLCVGMIACIGCILGHCFPIFMGFHGGKGLAAFAGMVLEYILWFALPIVIPGLLLIFILNTGVAAPAWGCAMFPILVACYHGSTTEIILATTASTFIAWMHRDNLRKALARADTISTKKFLMKIFKKNAAP